MATGDDDNDVDGDSAMGNEVDDDGNGATGDDNDNNDDGNGDDDGNGVDDGNDDGVDDIGNEVEEFLEFRKMRPGRNRNTKRNAPPSCWMQTKLSNAMESDLNAHVGMSLFTPISLTQHVA